LLHITSSEALIGLEQYPRVIDTVHALRLLRTSTRLCRAFDFVLQNLTTDGTTCTTLCRTVQSFDKLRNRGHTMYIFKAVLPRACASYCHLPHKVHFCIHTYITLQLHTLRLANFGFNFRTRSIRVRRWREKWPTVSQPRHAICRNCSRSKICTQWPLFHKLRVQECLCNDGWHPSKS